MTEFTFVDALPDSSPGARPDAVLVDFAAALRGHPGQWAVWPKDIKASNGRSAIASHIKRGTYVSFPKGEFEATSRRGAVYVRYVGAEVPA